MTKQKKHECQPASQPKTQDQRERDLDEAVNRVYQHYGNDLSAFYRDVQKEQELVKHED